jgi:hypothetical protein
VTCISLCVQVVSNHISQLRPYLACAKASSIRATLMAATGSVLLQVRALTCALHSAAGAPGCVCRHSCCIGISTNTVSYVCVASGHPCFGTHTVFSTWVHNAGVAVSDCHPLG